MNIFLQIFLYFDVFAIGAAFAVALRHAYAHFKPREAVKPTRVTNENNHLPQVIREKLLEESSEKFQHVLTKSAEQLEHDLLSTGERINITVKKLAADIITKELTGFQTMFRDYQEGAIKELEASKNQTDQYANELKDKVRQDIEAERDRLYGLVDNKLSDSIMSFLIEAMGHEVDLGSQGPYLLKLLDEHKEEFKQAIKDES